jgi:hypothetical protein
MFPGRLILIIQKNQYKSDEKWVNRLNRRFFKEPRLTVGFDEKKTTWEVNCRHRNRRDAKHGLVWKRPKQSLLQKKVIQSNYLNI